MSTHTLTIRIGEKHRMCKLCGEPIAGHHTVHVRCQNRQAPPREREGKHERPRGGAQLSLPGQPKPVEHPSKRGINADYVCICLCARHKAGECGQSAGWTPGAECYVPPSGVRVVEVMVDD